MATLEYVKAKDVEVRFHGRGKNEASHYCGFCEVSIKKCDEQLKSNRQIACK